jgi:hypothetical protein
MFLYFKFVCRISLSLFYHELYVFSAVKWNCCEVDTTTMPVHIQRIWTLNLVKNYGLIVYESLMVQDVYSIL